MKDALSNINSNNIINSFHLSKKNQKVLEKAWQFELYKSLCNCLPDNVYVSPEVGSLFCDNGIVDLYIPGYEWAVELLVDGLNLKKHWERFQLSKLSDLINFMSNINDSTKCIL